MKYRNFIKYISIIFLFVVPTVFAQDSQIRFAWLSDTHVGSPTGASDLREAVRDINAIDRIDFVILSGDITEMGSNSELELAKTILDSLSKPYYIIPGNHDTKWSESGCTKFPELFGNDKFVFEYQGYRFIGLHQGPLMRMGDGHFAPEDLRWLDSVLTNLPDPDQPLIFVTHYPIDISVDNWYEFLDQIKKYDAKVILVGHGHRNKVFDFEGVPGVMGRSSLRRDQSHGGYNIVIVQSDSMFFFERITGEKTNPIWHKLSLKRRDFSVNTTIYERPDFSINQQYPDVKIKWKFDTDFTIASTAAVWKNFVVVGNSAGKVICLSLKNGKKQWSFQAESSIFSSPDIAEGKVVFGSSDKNIYCLNIHNGDIIWQFFTEAPVVASPRIENGIFYIGGSDKKFRAIELNSGKLSWEYDGVTGFVETKPLIYQDKVIFGAWDTFLYALNEKDGTLAWKWSNGNPGVLYSPAACLPVAANNKIFIVAPDRFMTAIHAETGEISWRSNAHKVRETIGISEDGQKIYARCMEDTLFAFSSKTESPELIWATSCGYGYDIDPSMPMEKDNVIFFGTKNGFLFAIDAKSGEMKFKYRIGVALVNNVMPIDAHRIVLTDMDGRVMLVEIFK
jgi:outer membrane protein assembly factor BamB/predicted phosphodiesterase